MASCTCWNVTGSASFCAVLKKCFPRGFRTLYTPLEQPKGPVSISMTLYQLELDVTLVSSQQHCPLLQSSCSGEGVTRLGLPDSIFFALDDCLSASGSGISLCCVRVCLLSWFASFRMVLYRKYMFSSYRVLPSLFLLLCKQIN